MRHQHRQRDQSAEQAERIEQLEEAGPLVEHPHFVIDAERRALQEIADRDAEDERGNEPADEERVVPKRAPRGIVDLVSELEADGTHDERRQHEKYRDIEARERRCVNRRPGGEDRAAAEQQPDLVAVPDRTDRVDGDAPLDIASRDEGQQRRDAEVEAVHDGEADEQHAEEKPPDQAEDFVVDRNGHVRFLTRPEQRRG